MFGRQHKPPPNSTRSPTVTKSRSSPPSVCAAASTPPQIPHVSARFWILATSTTIGSTLHVTSGRNCGRLFFLRGHPLESEVSCVMNVRSGFRVHSSIASEASVLFDLTTKSARKLMVEPRDITSPSPQRADHHFLIIIFFFFLRCQRAPSAGLQSAAFILTLWSI